MAEHPWDAEALALLRGPGGMTSGELARWHSKIMASSRSQHKRAASALNLLRRLEAEGKVKRLDDLRPIAWLRVESDSTVEGS